MVQLESISISILLTQLCQSHFNFHMLDVHNYVAGEAFFGSVMQAYHQKAAIMLFF